MKIVRCRSARAGLIAILFIFPAFRASASSAIPLRVMHWLTLVPVRIGSETVLLELDLGADDQMGLTDRGIELLQAKRTAGKGSQLDVQGNVLHENRFIVPEFRIGDTTFRNVTAGRQEIVPYHLRGVYGHIGRGLLTHFRVELDLPHGRMWLWPPANGGPDDRCQGKVVPVLSERHGVLARVVTDYGVLLMLWDDGAPFNIIHPEVLQPGAGSSEHVTTHQFVLNGTNFGPQELYPMKFSEPPDIAGFIGYDFLAKHNICFDLPGRHVVIRK